MVQRRTAKSSVPNVNQSYVISVSLCSGCYRHIHISANRTLKDLHEVILEEAEFWDTEHLHVFFMDNHWWGNDSYYGYDPSGGNEPGDRLDCDYRLSQLSLCAGKRFLYVFDFGASWEFRCRVLRVLEEDVKETVVVRRKGDPPSQY